MQPFLVTILILSTPPETNRTIGLDFGLTTFLADSNGNKVKPRKFYLHVLRRIISNRAKARYSSQEGVLYGLNTTINRTREPSNNHRRFKRVRHNGQWEAS